MAEKKGRKDFDRWTSDGIGVEVIRPKKKETKQTKRTPKKGK